MMKGPNKDIFKLNTHPWVPHILFFFLGPFLFRTNPTNSFLFIQNDYWLQADSNPPIANAFVQWMWTSALTIQATTAGLLLFISLFFIRFASHLSLSLSLSLYLSLSVPFSVSLSLSLSLSQSISFSLSLCLCLCLSQSVSLFQSVSISVCLSQSFSPSPLFLSLSSISSIALRFFSN